MLKNNDSNNDQSIKGSDILPTIGNDIASNLEGNDNYLYNIK